MFLAEVAQIASFLTQQIIGLARQALLLCSTYSTQTVACNRRSSSEINLMRLSSSSLSFVLTKGTLRRFGL
jgi:hypothetical protein